MKRHVKKLYIHAGILFFSFILFTLLATFVDVRPIGPQGTTVGFSSINQFVFQHIGVHLLWYHITDWLGIFPILCAFGFAILGLYQLIKRKSIRKVDKELLLLGAFYLLTIACYLFFEKVVINCRPVILGISPEASYPSSHTVMAICLMATASVIFRSLWPAKKKLCLAVDIAAALIIFLTVFGRLLSGVHWLTDIAGGLLLSSALVNFYCAAAKHIKELESN